MSRAMGWWAFGAFVAIILVNQGGNTAQSPEAISKPLTQVPGLVSPEKEREITRPAPVSNPPRCPAPKPLRQRRRACRITSLAGGSMCGVGRAQAMG